MKAIVSRAGFSNYDESIPVSTVVVNWNGVAFLGDCVDSLLAQTLGGCEVIVVDNGSTDGSVPALHSRYGSRVRVVEREQNIGYGAGLNAGIHVARGRYLFALNNDTRLDPDCLARLVEVADRHANAGSIAPMILTMSDPTRLDNVGHLLYPDGLSRGRGRLEALSARYAQEEEILLASGCAVLLRRAMLADVGLFDEDLFAYCEDTDLGLRARLAGWTCWTAPAARLYHAYSASSGEYSPLKAFLVERNRAWVALRCLPAPLLLASPFFTTLRLGTQAFGALTQRGAAGRFVGQHSALSLMGILLRAGAAAARGAPRCWRQRREIQGRRRISSVDSLRWVSRRYRMGVREVALRE